MTVKITSQETLAFVANDYMTTRKTKKLNSPRKPKRIKTRKTEGSDTTTMSKGIQRATVSRNTNQKNNLRTELMKQQQ